MLWREQAGTYGVSHRFRLTEQDDYFGSILTTFKPSIIFSGSLGSSVKLLEPLTEPPSGYLACQNP